MIPGIGIGIGFNAPKDVKFQRIVSIPDKISWLRSDFGIVKTDVTDLVTNWNKMPYGTVSSSAEQTIERLQPKFYASGGVNNLPYLNFGELNVGKFLKFPAGTMANVIQAEVFLVLKRDAQPPTAGLGGLYNIPGTLIGAHVPYIDGNIYDEFASNVRHNAGSIASNIVTNTHFYNASSMSGEWRNAFNGVELFSTNTNGVSFLPTIGIGASITADMAAPEIFLQGKFYEFLFFRRKLTATERSYVIAYLKARYSIT